MKILELFLIPLVFAVSVSANKAFVTWKDSQVCTGMYSKNDWSGNINNPFIKLNLQSFQNEAGNSDDIDVSVVIFEYRDIDTIGVEVDGVERYICDESLIALDYCNTSMQNTFILESNATSYNQVLSTRLTEIGDNDLTYFVKETGYYCVATYSATATNYKILINFQNAFGNLAASEISKLPLYGLLAVIYAVCLCIYLFQVFKHRAELLLLQKYLAGFFIFLTVENILIWSLYDVQNNNKRYPLPAGIKFYMFFISVLNSFKISFSFFLLLIISLGYGVVYPKLNKKLMLKCKLLGLIHFIFGVFYLIVSYIRESSISTNPTAATTSTESSNSSWKNSLLTLLSTLPLAITLTIFYFLILSSLSKTVKFLTENRQIIKLNMYKKLFKLIFFSLLMMVLAMVIVTLLFFNDSVTNAIEKFWKFNDVLMDFWPSCLYFVVFIGIAIIWRPTDTSYMLAASSQLPQNDSEANAGMGHQMQGTEFELDDLQSDDETDQQATNGGAAGNPFVDPPAYSKINHDNDSIDLELGEDADNADEDDDDNIDDFNKKKQKPSTGAGTAGTAGATAATVGGSGSTQHAPAKTGKTIFQLDENDEEEEEDEDEEDGFDEWESTQHTKKKDD